MAVCHLHAAMVKTKNGDAPDSTSRHSGRTMLMSSILKLRRDEKVTTEGGQSRRRLPMIPMVWTCPIRIDEVDTHRLREDGCRLMSQM